MTHPRPWGAKSFGRWANIPCEVSEPIGEIWLVGPESLRRSGGPIALEFLRHHLDPQIHCPLIKLLRTSQPLSVQVHPPASQARQRGARGGKHEAWLVLEAEAGAQLGIGFEHPVDAPQLSDAALAGRAARLLAWRPAVAGDIHEIRAGTVHAIGAGVTILEIQQPADVTYRIDDYGRGRPLHLEAALAVAHLGAGAVAAPGRAGAVDGTSSSAGASCLLDADWACVRLVTCTREAATTMGESKNFQAIVRIDPDAEVDGEAGSAMQAWLRPPGAPLTLGGSGRVLISELRVPFESDG